MVDIGRKDEIYKRIVELESTLDRQRIERIDLTAIAKQQQKERDAAYEMYLKVQEHYQTQEMNYRKSSSQIREMDEIGKLSKEELERLKRELSRMHDIDQVNARYAEQVESFKSKCLDSAWRAENRTDGMGALPHQLDGAIHLAVAERAILGDKRGLGKTLTALITLDLKDARKVIAVVPSDAVDNFIREAQLWTPHRTPFKLSGMSKGQRDFVLPILRKLPEFLVVLNYESWRLDEHLIPDLIALQADTIIADEAHHAKTMKTVQGAGLQEIRYGVNTCPMCLNPTLKKVENKEYQCWCSTTGPITDFCTIKNVIPMTGTPIKNRPQELFPLLRIIDIKNFDDESKYLADFCKKNKDGKWTWRFNGEKELMKKIGPRYLARDREAAGVIIPPVGEVEHFATMNELKSSHPRQHEAYLQAREYAEIALNPDTAMAMPNHITALLRMRQILVWPAAIKMELPELGYSVHLDVKESWKLDMLEEQIKEINDEGERVIVFSQFKDGLHELGRRLGARSAIYDGSTSPKHRNAIQLDFDVKTAPASPLWDNVLCNYKSAGEALNFNTATHTFAPDREWNPGGEGQAIGRMDRIGQTKDTYFHKLMVGTSVDTWMDSIIREKADLIGGFETEADLYKQAYDALRRGEM